MSNKQTILHKENSREEIIDLKRYLIIVYQHKWILLLFILFCTSLAITYSLLKSPVYESNFSIYYKQIVNNKEPGRYNNSNTEEPDSEFWLKVMNTPRMLELTQKNAGITLNAKYINQVFTVSQEKKNNSLFNIKVKADKATDIQVLAKSYVTSLNQIERENNTQRLSSLLGYLRNQLAENKKKLRETNRDIAELSNLLNIDEITDREQLKKIYNSYKKSLKDLKIKLSTTAAEKKETQKEFTHLKDTLFYETSFSEPLKVQLMNLKIDLARSLTKYKAAHPHILRIKENIKKVETLLKKGIDQNIEIKNLSANPIKRDLLGRLAKIKIDEQSILAEIEATQTIISNFTNQMNINSEDKGIQQKLSQREQLIAAIKLLNKEIIETDTFLRGSTNNFITINPAAIPLGKSNKALLFFIAIGLLAGTILGIGFIIILDLIDNRLKIISDVENYYNINVLGTFLHRKKGHDIKPISNQDPEDINRQYYRELTEMRINLDQLMPNKEENLISVISPDRREGKTTTAFLLAKEYARANKRVLLIDLDTYLPKLTKSLGFTKEKGLQDFLLTDERLYNCIHRTNHTNIDIIGCGQNTYNNQIFYDNARFEELLKEASQKYDKVILDTPGLLFFPEIVSILKKINYVVIITRMQRTTRHKLDNLIKKINTLPTQILGTIITDVHTSPFNSEYSYYKNNYYSEKEKNRFNGTLITNKKIKYVTYSGIAIIAIALSLFIYNKTLGTNKNVTVAKQEKQPSVAGKKSLNYKIQHLTVSKTKADKKTVTKKKDIATNNITTKKIAKQDKQIKAEKPASTITSVQTKPQSKKQTIVKAQPTTKAPTYTKVPAKHKKYMLVANCFKSQENADRNCDLLQSKGYSSAFVLEDKANYKVILDSYSSAREALKYLHQYEKDVKTWVYKKQ